VVLVTMRDEDVGESAIMTKLFQLLQEQ
jgi:hypothetical protein